MARWRLDPEHTAAVFEVRHMMVTWVNGRFTRVSGALSFEPTDVERSLVEVEIDAASLFTGVERRDNHLKSPDFLDVERFPKITFRSTGVEVAGLDLCKAHGELSVHGMTRPVTLDVRYAGPIAFDDEDRRYTTYGFRATTEINREDFGMVWNMDVENKGFMVGKHVRITLHAEADLVEE